MKSLKDLSVGDECRVKKIIASESMHRRFLDIGLVNRAQVKCVGESPGLDPKAYLIRGAVIAIRSEDAEKILVTEE